MEESECKISHIAGSRAAPGETNFSDSDVDSEELWIMKILAEKVLREA